MKDKEIQGLDLMSDLQISIKQMSLSLKSLRKTGSIYYQAEHDYKVKVHEVVLRMKDEGQPATLINLLVYGEKEVAKLRLARDLAKTLYEANQESINVLKLQSRLLDNQIKREWGSGE